MDIKVKLEDEKLCQGCPLEDFHSAKCKGGHVRTMAKLLEVEGHVGFGQRGTVLTSLPARPISCMLANEHALTAIKGTPEAAEDERRPIKLTPPLRTDAL